MSKFDTFDDITKIPDRDEVLEDLEGNGVDQFEDYLAERAAGDLPDEAVEETEETDDPETPIIIDDDLIDSGLPSTKTDKVLEANMVRRVEEMKPPREKRQIIEGREHAIIGKYVVRRAVDVPDYPWQAEVWNNTHHVAVTEMTIEQIREVQLTNEEAIKRYKVQNHALTAAQEDLILKLSPEEAEAYRVRAANDKSYRPKKAKKVVKKGITRTKAGVVRARSAAEKYAKANQDMSLTKDENIVELKSMGPKFWSDEISKFIDAIYESE